MNMRRDFIEATAAHKEAVKEMLNGMIGVYQKSLEAKEEKEKLQILSKAFKKYPKDLQLLI
jgi:chemotaxis protein CheY-P-specific phosphatase CheC